MDAKICDRCGVLMKGNIKSRSITKLSKRIYHPDESSTVFEYDLCGNCEKDFIDFIENKKEYKAFMKRKKDDERWSSR